MNCKGSKPLHRNTWSRFNHKDRIPNCVSLCDEKNPVKACFICIQGRGIIRKRINHVSIIHQICNENIHFDCYFIFYYFITVMGVKKKSYSKIKQVKNHTSDYVFYGIYKLHNCSFMTS